MLLGKMRIVLWQDNVGKLEQDKCYRIEMVTVREYAGTKYLSLSEMSRIQEVDDIGKVLSIEDEDVEEVGQGLKEKLSLSSLLKSMPAALTACKGKVQIINDIIGECSKCNTKVKLARLSVKFIVEDIDKK